MFDIQRIEKERVLQGITKQELSRKASIDPSTYARIVAGSVENPHAPTIKSLCDALGLRMEEVYVEDPQETRIA